MLLINIIIYINICLFLSQWATQAYWYPLLTSTSYVSNNRVMPHISAAVHLTMVTIAKPLRLIQQAKAPIWYMLYVAAYLFYNIII